MSSQIRKLGSVLLLLCAVFVWARPTAAQFGRKPKEPKLAVQLLANTAAVKPGTPFELALLFKIEKRWHIYWKNSGDTGMAPVPNWQLPEGFTISDLIYPVPQRHIDPGDLVTNILDGEPILLAKVTPPAALDPGSSVTFAANLRVLVCQKQCIMLTRQLSLTLPVAAAAAPDDPANIELFEQAHAALPKPTSSAKYAQVKAVSSVDAVQAQSEFKLGVVLDVDPGLLIQSHEPQKNLIATDVYLETTEGIDISRGDYPEPQKRSLPDGRQVTQYSGRIVVTFDAHADNQLDSDQLRFAGLVQFQACDNAGKCLPTQNIDWSLELPVVPPGGAVRQINGEYFGSSAMGDDGSVAPPTIDGSNDSSTDSAVADNLAAPATAAGGVQDDRTLVAYLVFAFLGGLILNVMPCVLPVISIKILSFVQQSGESRRRVFQLGLAFSAGIVISFLMLAVLVIMLQGLGKTVGWGFQLANPYAVIFFTAIIFLFGLSLFGVFEFKLPGAVNDSLGSAELREGLPGSFVKGVLATILATPCTAPFLGAAVGWAFVQPPATIVLMLMTVGVGMASPYLLLTAKPAWLNYLPRPGQWMVQFKQFMGFVLMGTVIWLFFTLGDLIGPTGLNWTLAFFCFIALAAWIIGTITPSLSTARQWTRWAFGVGVVAVGWLVCFRANFDILNAWETPASSPRQLATSDLDYSSIPWQPWSAGIGPRLAAQGYTVYVDYTATWCATCQTNKKLVLESEAVRQKMKELCVVPIKADYTKQPAQMHSELVAHGRAGVPLNLIIPAHRPESATVLPEQLVGRQELVLRQLDAAGPSDQCASTASSQIAALRAP